MVSQNHWQGDRLRAAISVPQLQGKTVLFSGLLACQFQVTHGQTRPLDQGKPRPVPIFRRIDWILPNFLFSHPEIDETRQSFEEKQHRFEWIVPKTQQSRRS